MRTLFLLLAFLGFGVLQAQDTNIEKAKKAIAANQSSYTITSNLEKTLKTNPNHPEALVLLAQQYNKDNNYRKALDPLNKLLVLDPTHKQALFERSEALAGWGLKNYEFEDGVTKAIADLDQLIALGETTAAVYYRKATLQEQLADDFKNKIEFESVTELKQKTIKLYTAALANYEAAAKLDPNDTAISNQMLDVPSKIEMTTLL